MTKNVNNFILDNIINMSNKEYDIFMVSTFPSLFINRNKSIKESTMAWGFDIPQIWQGELYRLCEQLTNITNKTNIQIHFDQIKEKFMRPRFYITTIIPDNMSENEYYIWDNIINTLVSASENRRAKLEKN